MRQRVIESARVELQRGGARNGWTFAAAVAAAVVVWINLSMSATLATDCGYRPDTPRRPLDEVAGQIQQLLPELPEGEAMRQAALLQAGSHLPEYPTLSAGPAAPRRLRNLDDLLPQGE
jgi:hypothetical protein